MFGFLVIFALLLVLSFGWILRILGSRHLLNKARNEHETLIVQVVLIILVDAMAALLIYDNLLLKLGLNIFSFFIITLDFLLNTTACICNYCWTKVALYSILIRRLVWPWYCTSAEIDELLYCLIWPGVIFTATASYIDYSLEWYFRKLFSRHAPRLLTYGKSHGLAVFPRAVAAGKDSWKYARDTHTILKLAAENTDMSAKKKSLESAHADAVLREASAILTIALFGKELKLRGDKILSLEDTSRILKCASETWYQENEQLKKGAPEYQDRQAHEHQMDLMQDSLNQQSRNNGILKVALKNEEKRRELLLEHLHSVRMSDTKRADLPGEGMETQKAEYQAQLEGKIAEIGRLRAQIRQKDKYKVDLEDQLEEQKLKTESAVKSNNTVKMDSAVQTDSVVEIDSPVQTDRAVKTDCAVQTDNAAKHDKTRQQLAALKNEKEALQDRVNTLEEEVTKAGRETKELQSKVDESIIESSNRANALQNELTTKSNFLQNAFIAKSNALDEKTQAHNQLAQMHRQCPSQQEFQDLVAHIDASKEREATMSAELQRLSNIEKEKSLMEQNASETTQKLQQAEVTIATQQKMLQDHSSMQPEHSAGAGQDPAVLQQLAEAKHQISLYQNEIQRLSNIEQEKLAADKRAAQTAQRLQQATTTVSQQMQQMQKAETKFTEQQTSLNQAAERIHELESQVQDANKGASASNERAGALQAQLMASKNSHSQDLTKWTALQSNFDKDRAADQGSIRCLQEEINNEREKSRKELRERDDQIRILRTSSNMTSTQQQDREELAKTNVKYAKCLRKVEKLEKELGEPCMDCGRYEQENRVLKTENARLEEENEDMADELNVSNEEFEVDHEVHGLSFKGLREKCMSLKYDNKGLHNQVAMWKERYKRKEAALQTEGSQGENGAETRMLQNQLRSTQEALDESMRTNESLQQQLDVVLGPGHPKIGGESEDESSEGEEDLDKSEYDDEVDYDDD